MKNPVFTRLTACVLLAPVSVLFATAADSSKPIAPTDLVVGEVDGVVVIEAEHFVKQSLTDKRAWHITSPDSIPDLKPDTDPPHLAGASGGAYLEILPDSRWTHAQKLVNGENFTNTPGQMAVLHYKVNIDTPGRYYVWLRVQSTGGEDNGAHVGIDGKWPESGMRWQTTQKRKWAWDCRQRTDKTHGGVPMQLFLDIDKPGKHEFLISMREDGFELDKILLSNKKDYAPEGVGPAPKVISGKIPVPFAAVQEAAAQEPQAEAIAETGESVLLLKASDIAPADSGFYLDKGKWLAIDPVKNKTASIEVPVHFADGNYHVTLQAVGEEDGKSSYQVSVNGSEVGEFTCPLSKEKFEEGSDYRTTWKNISVNGGDVITITANVASEDGKEFSRARWASLDFVPADKATRVANAKLKRPAAVSKSDGPASVMPRMPDGGGKVTVSGELKQWHKVSVTLDGPFAAEMDKQPNPFTDCNFTVTFTHESGTPSYQVPGFFAADGNAAESGASSGTKWRAHLSPDKTGTWTYTTSFTRGKHAALDGGGKPLAPFDGVKGSFTVAASDKTAPDFRAKGRLRYVGKHYLEFSGNNEVFVKVGPDAPETFLAYTDFDNTVANKPKVPLKSWSPHLKDWKTGDPSWKGGKGKGIIGALNYLSGKGVNAISFLTYNAGGDGDNVWPFVERGAKFHYDCSKLDQWTAVLDHSQALGLYLHFKTQENENDDSNGPGAAQSLDGGDLGPERKLYYRELVARFGHELALNWSLGEENTQNPAQQRDLLEYLHKIDPYQHLRVIHTFPPQQDKVYSKLLGKQSLLTGASLQNPWDQVHQRTLKWVGESAKAGTPWVVANDEQNSAAEGVPPDPGYEGFKGKAGKGKGEYDLHDIRKLTLWGNLMAGGAGVEYYFGYKLPQNDLLAEDYRSRDKSWEFGAIAIDFFRDHKIPLQDMVNANALIGNDKNDNSKYCLAKENELYLVYLPEGGGTDIRLPSGNFSLEWFNPRTGECQAPSKMDGNSLSAPDQEDWLAVIRKR